MLLVMVFWFCNWIEGIRFWLGLSVKFMDLGMFLFCIWCLFCSELLVLGLIWFFLFGYSVCCVFMWVECFGVWCLVSIWFYLVGLLLRLVMCGWLGCIVGL